jgi:hypothetical protein
MQSNCTNVRMCDCARMRYLDTESIVSWQIHCWLLSTVRQ